MSSLNLLMLSTDQELRKLLYLLGVDGRSPPTDGIDFYLHG